jgi:hypothetical protein
MRPASTFIALLVGLAMQLSPMAVAPARAATEACTPITSVPWTISAPGVYCLHQDFVAPGHANTIGINAGPVVLDCNGHALRGAGGAYGITVVHDDVTVRDCVVDNYLVGIYLQSSPGGVGVRILDNTVLNSRYDGIQSRVARVEIAGNRIRGNLGWGTRTTGIDQLYCDYCGFIYIHDNTISDFSPGPGMLSYGIYFRGDNVHVVDNAIASLYGDQGVYGIYSDQARNAVVTGNTITGGTPRADPLDGPMRWGILLSADPAYRAVCRDNLVGGFEQAIGGCVSDQDSTY